MCEKCNSHDHSTEQCGGGKTPAASDGYTQHSIAMAKAIQAFRNLPMLRDLTELRGTKGYYDLCETWKAFDDATGMKHRV